MSVTELKEPVWIDTPAGMESLIHALSQTNIFAIDTESNSLFAYREQVCLIQISTLENDYLIDPLALKNLSALGPLFADPSIEKVFHAGEYDLICLKRDFGFEFSHLFDTMIAGRILGREVFGLSAMLEEHFGVVLDKKWQRANWGIRPMPAKQLAYARMDSHFLIPLRDRLKRELEEAGRTALAEEDFRRLERTPIPRPNNDNCWKICGKEDLTIQQMAILQRLFEYRENRARKANLPSFKVISNNVLIEIAKIIPMREEDLVGIKGLSPLLIKRHGENLLECVRQGQQTNPPRRPSYPRKDELFIERYENLKSWRKKTAACYHVESDVILPREILEQVAGVNPRSESELAALMANFPHRLEKFGHDILEAINHKEK